MYATCLFCNKSLGANESFESFPVGKRLAFDAEKGRLWVVCPHCERWNLSPLEERWEAIEQAERYYRDTRKRVATDNIGLAKLRDGTTIVRIGQPMRPEFAAWRYGDQFGRRRNRCVGRPGRRRRDGGGGHWKLRLDDCAGWWNDHQRRPRDRRREDSDRGLRARLGAAPPSHGDAHLSRHGRIARHGHPVQERLGARRRARRRAHRLDFDSQGEPVRWIQEGSRRR